MSWKKYNGYYVYTYLDEDSNPYYVGMGKNNRMIARHLYVEVPLYERIVVIDNLTQQEARDKEIELIAQYGRQCDSTGPLKNLAKGGPTQKSGWSQSEETKNNISKSNTGKVRTEEHKKNYSKPKTAEHAENIRKANIGRLNDGRYEKIGLTMSLKRWYTDGTISKMFVPAQVPAEFTPGRISWKQPKVGE